MNIDQTFQRLKKGARFTNSYPRIFIIFIYLDLNKNQFLALEYTYDVNWKPDKT